MANPADVQVKVPQPEGEVVISLGGNEPTHYLVSKGGEVTVPAKDVDHFLRLVPGAQRVEEAG